MRFVVDNNVLSEIRKTTVLTPARKRRITLVLPPLIWAEAIGSRDNLRCLLDYNLRFGRDVSDVLRDAALVTDAQLVSVETLVRKRTPTHKECRVDLLSCQPQRAARAREIKAGNRQDMDRIGHVVEEHLSEDRRRVELCIEPGKFKSLTSFDNVIEQLKPCLQKIPFRNPNDDPAPARTYWELLKSRHVGLTNFVRFHLAITFAKTGAWADSRLNRQGPSGKRDDVSDMTLPLYAETGDIIVTNDKWFQRLFRLVVICFTQYETFVA